MTPRSKDTAWEQYCRALCVTWLRKLQGQVYSQMNQVTEILFTLPKIFNFPCSFQPREAQGLAACTRGGRMRVFPNLHRQLETSHSAWLRHLWRGAENSFLSPQSSGYACFQYYLIVLHVFLTTFGERNFFLLLMGTKSTSYSEVIEYSWTKTQSFLIKL